MHIAALDTRLRVAVSSGWPTSTANMRRMHCPCWNFQGLGEISNASEQNRQAWLIGKLTAMVWWTEQNFEFSDIFGLVRNRTAKPRQVEKLVRYQPYKSSLTKTSVDSQPMCIEHSFMKKDSLGYVGVDVYILGLALHDYISMFIYKYLSLYIYIYI